jgi:hypothetical protein
MLGGKFPPARAAGRSQTRCGPLKVSGVLLESLIVEVFL